MARRREEELQSWLSGNGELYTTVHIMYKPSQTVKLLNNVLLCRWTSSVSLRLAEENTILTTCKSWVWAHNTHIQFMGVGQSGF